MIDEKDRHLFRLAQSEFPISSRPFRDLGKMAGMTEKETIIKLRKLKKMGLIRRIGPVWDAKSLGCASLLVAFRVRPADLEKSAAVINRCKGVTHNYLRRAKYNLWFTLTSKDIHSQKTELNRLVRRVKPLAHLALPALKIYKIGVKLEA